jgi:hypothetical protein
VAGQRRGWTRRRKGDAAKLTGSGAPPALDVRTLARYHETYERLAPSFGYATRRETAVPWDQVPARNQQLMIAVCEEILALLRDPARAATSRPPADPP